MKLSSRKQLLSEASQTLRKLREVGQDEYLNTKIDAFIKMVLSNNYNGDVYVKGMEAISDKYRSLETTPEYKKFTVLAREFKVERDRNLAKKVVSALEDLSDKLYENKLPSSSQRRNRLREADEKIAQKVENAVKRMREATKKLNRSEALFELAKLLAEQKYSKILDHTAEIRKIAGTMPYGIQQYENELMTEMLAKAKQRFNAKEYAAIYSAL